MKAAAPVGALHRAVRHAAAGCPSRAALPALLGVRLSAAADGVLTTSGTDYERWHTATCDGSTAEPGEVLVPGRLLEQVLSRLPSWDEVEFHATVTRLQITCGRSLVALPLLSLEALPAEPELARVAGSVRLADLLDAVAAVASAAAVDGALPVLTGIHLKSAAGAMTLATTDRYRLHVAEVPYSGQDDLTALVPAKDLSAAVRGLLVDRSATDTQVSLHPSESLLALVADQRTARLRQLSEDFPRYQHLLREPSDDDGHLLVDGERLRELIDRAGPMLDRYGHVQLVPDGDRLRLLIDGEQGAFDDDVPAEVRGGQAVTISAPYLADALSALELSEPVRIGYGSTALKPLTLRTGPGRCTLVMPVKAAR